MKPFFAEEFLLQTPQARALYHDFAEGMPIFDFHYVMNARDNDLIASMIGNFQDGAIPGKMQFGSAWWFNDQKDGIEKQLDALSNMGLLSRFVGMVTDSRSFLSYPRHEYFRRVLCNRLGTDVAKGELPEDLELIGGMVKDICFRNAVAYFGIEVK